MIFKTLSWPPPLNLPPKREAYLELVLAVGEDAFEMVSDQFNIRELVAAYEEIMKKLKSIK